MNLTNSTDGGEGTQKGYIFSRETRNKMSVSKTGIKFTEEHCRKISESNLGNANFKNHTHSEETKKRIKESNIGKNVGKIPWNKGRKKS